MVRYYRYMCPRRSYVLAPLTETSNGPKVRKILWNDALEFFKELNHVVSAETLLIYSYWKILLTAHTDYSDKKLGYFISQNNKHISFFSRILSKKNVTMI